MSYDYSDRMNAERGYFHTTEGEALKEFCADQGIRPEYRNEVCDTCCGEGTRALHGYALDEEQTSDPEFMADYMAGKYDTRCDECDGQRVVKVAAFTDPAIAKAWKRWLREVRADNAESLAELRMGC